MYICLIVCSSARLQAVCDNENLGDLHCIKAPGFAMTLHGFSFAMLFLLHQQSVIIPFAALHALARLSCTFATSIVRSQQALHSSGHSNLVRIGNAGCTGETWMQWGGRPGALLDGGGRDCVQGPHPHREGQASHRRVLGVRQPMRAS